MASPFGDYLREMRQARRLPVTRAAETAGVSRRAWTAWESGTTQPRRVEAEAALKVLGASPEQVSHALSLIVSPWARRLERSDTSARLSLPAPVPDSGALLAAMRRRARLTLGQMASALNVRPSTVHRWEKGTHVPPEDLLRDLLAVVRALPEERGALAFGGLALSAGERGPVSLEALDDQAMTLCNDACHGAHLLMDLRFLALESDLWRIAPRVGQARWTLSQVYTWHSMWLCWRGREPEAGVYADSALRLLLREFQSRAEFGRPLHTSIRASLHHGLTPRDAIRTLENWLPVITTPAHQAWMLRDLAGLQGDAGYHDAAVTTSERAYRVALTLPDAYEIRCAQADRASVFLKAGRYNQALGAMSSDVDTTAGVPAQFVREFQIRAESLMAVGDVSSAQDCIQQAYIFMDRYALHSHRPAIDALALKV